MKKSILLSLFIWWITPIIANGQPTTITYQEDFSAFANPERGWYRSINPGYNDAPTPWLTVADLQALRNGADKITLIRKYYLLKDFRSSSIPQWYLDNVKADLQACRDAGVKLIPRFSYLWSLGVGPNADQDAPLNIVLQHLDQLKPIFNNYKDAIAWVQAGLVGKWGEWHSSSNNHVDNYSLEILSSGLQIRDKLLAVVPANRFVAMRYFEHHKLPFWSEPLTQSQAYDGSAQARISTHHDRLMHEENWALPPCGSCPPYQEMKDYLMEDSKWALYEGEPESSGNYYKKNDPRVEFAELHMTAVANNANGTAHYDYWKQQGWYSGLTKHLGYRLKLTEATIDGQVNSGESFSVSLTIDNLGYASPVNARKFEILLRNTNDGSVHKTDVTDYDGANTDPRYWLPGSRTVDLTVPVPSTLANGTYEVLVNLADPSPLLYDRPEYSIRLANQDIWEPETGYNKLNHTLSVGEGNTPPPPAPTSLMAFPGAEGFGATTTHGRGGQVIEVTNLNDSGPGSFRAAVEASGKRIIVFRIGGVIQLNSTLILANPFCMIAGQTAPGDGICIKGAGLTIATHDVVVRYMRFRPGDGAGEDPENRDGLQVFPYGINPAAYNIVIDHCSISWGIDENVSFYGALDPNAGYEVRDITIQWSIISEGLEESLHPKGGHSKGLLVAGGAHNISMHHCLLAHNVERNPLFKTGTNADLVNNLLYNAPGGVGFVNEDNNANHPNPSALNLVGNIAVEGPNTQGDGYILKVDGQYLTKKAQFYLKGNISKNRTGNNQDEWAGADVFNTTEDQYRTNQPALDAPAVTTSNAFEAYDTVLAQAGAMVPVRDAVDTRIVSEVEGRTGSFIDSPAQVGGYPTYSGGTAPADMDQDGMPDSWEAANGLNANDASDRNGDANGNGYTNVEDYLNQLTASQSSAGESGTGLKYTLYNGKTLSGPSIESGVDATVNFNWQSGGKGPGLPSDNFSVRWLGQVQPEHSETYTFYTQADDGTRLWVNGKLLIDDWTNHAVREKQGQITLQAGQKYDIKLEYFENGGKAVCKLLWSSPSQSKQVIPSANLFIPNVSSARSSDQPFAKPGHPVEDQGASLINIFPNPSSQGAFMVQGLSENSQLRMYDVQGRAIPITQQAVSGQQVQLLPVSTLPPGLYVVQIRQPNGQLWQRKVTVGE